MLLVCGIANPKPLKQYLQENTATYYQMDYGDHYIFRIDDLNDIRKKFNAMSAANKMIITTEKDAVRLLKFNEELSDLPLYVLPVQHRFLFGEAEQFNAAIINYILNFKFEEQKV